MLFTRKEAADYLKVSYGTLEVWAKNGKSPPFARIGKAIRYDKKDIDQWLEDKKMNGTNL